MSYSEHNQTLAMLSMEVTSENMNAASVHLHQLHGVGPTEVIDVTVTCDGTCIDCRLIQALCVELSCLQKI